MKRILCLFVALAMVILCSIAFAEYDFSQMTDEEITDFITQAQAELKKRTEGKEKSLVLYDENDVKIYLTGVYSSQQRTDAELFYFEYVVENNTNHDIELNGHDGYVNDWAVSSVSFYGYPNAGKKAKDVFCVDIKPASISTFEEIEKVEFTLCIFFDKPFYSSKADLEKKVTIIFENGEFYVQE